jgi:hypothetical protein
LTTKVEVAAVDVELEVIEELVTADEARPVETADADKAAEVTGVVAVVELELVITSAAWIEAKTELSIHWVSDVA